MLWGQNKGFENMPFFDKDHKCKESEHESTNNG